MKIKYLRAKNFLAIQNGPFEVDFSQYGNIVQVKGYNRDYGEGASNGAGKSTLIECLVYGLYGKLIKGLNHREAINIKSKKGLEVEIHFDDYKILRKRKPDELRFWKGDEELTLGGMPATQDLINNTIGLQYESFINVACFGQHNERGFLRCDAAEKRAIAENLLSLDRYVKFNKVAKDRRINLLDKIKDLAQKFELSLGEITGAKRRLEKLREQQINWQKLRLEEIERLTLDLEIQKKCLSSAGASDAFVEKRQQIEEVENQLKTLENQRKIIADGVEKLETKLQTQRDQREEHGRKVNLVETQISNTRSIISELEANNEAIQKSQDATCPLCLTPLEKKKIQLILQHNLSKIEANIKIIKQLEDEREVYIRKTNDINKAIQELVDIRRQAKDKENQANTKISAAHVYRTELAKAMPKETNAAVLLIESKIENIQKHIQMKQAEQDPYGDLMDVVEGELATAERKNEEIRTSLTGLEQMIPYLDFWVKAFGDGGIRAFVIDEIVPSLNSKINYWLQFLIENKIQLHFDNQLQERIERFTGDGNPFVYNSLSGGEHQRIDLAISLAFAHVMMLTSGSCPSVVALDEVGTNLDRPGIQAIYRTICELSRTRQVLVTTHHPDLQEMLSSHDTIEIEMSGGETRMC